MATTKAQSIGAERLRAINRRTGALLVAIALVFFVGIIVTQYLGGVAAGFTVLGIAVLLYVAVALGRNARARK